MKKARKDVGGVQSRKINIHMFFQELATFLKK